MSDSPSSESNKKAWQRPEISRHQLTAEELTRIDQADDPDAELHRVLSERERRPQAGSESGGGW